MTIQQLEYILAVDSHRHFARAADACYVTQPTLSMMIHKLEEELDVKIFDRSRHPVTPTPVGAKIISQARVALKSFYRVREMVEEEREMLQGVFRVGVIPTIAPYFLPVFLPAFVRAYPQVQLVVTELVTTKIIQDLLEGLIDGAILATPLHEAGLEEHPLYYERFMAYVSKKEPAYRKKTVSVEDIRADRLWLLEEGHCFRSQIIHYCDLRKKDPAQNGEGFVYEAGSIETLIRLVDRHGGMTIIPEMAAGYVPAERSAQLKPFGDPVPVREISLVTRADFMRYRLIRAIQEEVRQVLPPEMTGEALKKFIVDI